ncbi:MAG TPA: hypothetical protein VGR73_11710 [Bryobacteraceae bacterium]|nr:hypothetical protein [Bryobacteraceae bacterium]
MITGQLFVLDGAAVAALFKSIFVLWLSIATFWTLSVTLRKLHRNRVRRGWRP